MPRVQFTNHLRRFFPKLEDGEFEGETVAAIVGALEKRHPGLSAYLVDERGALRQHVNIYVEDSLVLDRARLSDKVGPSTRLFIMQALSGG